MSKDPYLIEMVSKEFKSDESESEKKKKKLKANSILIQKMGMPQSNQTLNKNNKLHKAKIINETNSKLKCRLWKLNV